MADFIDVRNVCKHIYGGHLKMSGTNPNGDKIDFTNYYMTLNDTPFFTISGEFHFSRYETSMWEEEILKTKSCGLSTIATYMFWNHHEEEKGKFDFTGSKDIRRFIELCRKHDLYVILRIGPYAHGECRNGGLPDWMFGMPFEERSNDPEYLYYVERLYNEIGKQVCDLMFKKGGPIIAIQLENEYMGSCSPWEITVSQNREWTTCGRDGLAHIEKLQQLAKNAGFDPCFYTATAWGNAPYIDGEMLPLYGGYAFWPWIFWGGTDVQHPLSGEYIFEDAHKKLEDGTEPKYPAACCEMGGGMQVWYNYRFIVPPESVEAAFVTKIASGNNFLGYYMFHGGCNPKGKDGFLNEQLTPRISYDFQAPLGDFGQTRESFKRIKLLHFFANTFSNNLCNTFSVLPDQKNPIDPANTKDLRFALRSNGESGYVFIGNYQDHLDQTDKENVKFEIKTKNGTVNIPENSCMTILKDVACILPFNFDIEGSNLRYSTAQLITKTYNGENTAYFFFTHNGIDGEFCFDDTNLKACSTYFADSEIKNGRLFIKCRDNNIRHFTLKSPKKTMDFFVLDRQESLNLWQLKIDNQDTVIISNANITEDHGKINAEVLDSDHIYMYTYPRLSGKYSCKGGTLDYMGLENGLHHYHISILNDINKKIIVTKKYDNKAIISIDASLLDKVSEMYLNIDYIGDIGWAFINGELIHDNFYNGTTWQIGLKRFTDKLKEHPLYIYVSPFVKGSSIAVIENTAARKELFSSKTADIINVSLSVEKTITLIKE